MPTRAHFVPTGAVDNFAAGASERRTVVNVPAGVLVTMGIRQLPSGSFQVRFQLHGVSHAATYPTRDMAEEAEILMRADALPRPNTEGLNDADLEADDDGATQTPTWRPPPAEVTPSSAEAAAVIDALFADFDAPVASEESPDVLLTTGQAAALLGVSRPTVVAWVEAGRIPFERRGTHRRLRIADVRTYLDDTSSPVPRRQR